MNSKTKKTETVFRYRLKGTAEIHEFRLERFQVNALAVEFDERGNPTKFDVSVTLCPKNDEIVTLDLNEIADWHEFEVVEIPS